MTVCKVLCVNGGRGREICNKTQEYCKALVSTCKTKMQIRMVSNVKDVLPFYMQINFYNDVKRPSFLLKTNLFCSIKLNINAFSVPIQLKTTDLFAHIHIDFIYNVQPFAMSRTVTQF